MIFSTHPRTFKKIEARNIRFNPLIRNLKPFGFSDYCRLQKDAFCVLSDSGTLSEESNMLSFPAVLIRNSTERPEAVDAGSVVIGGCSSESILSSIELSVNMTGRKNDKPSDYLDTNVSEKVVKIIQGYTPIIDEFIWKKDRV